MPRKVQSQLLVPLTTRDRADALALVIPDSRAEIYRRALEIGLNEMEDVYAEQLKTLDQTAKKLRMGRAEMAGRMAEAGIDLAEVQARGFPVPITTT